MKAVRSPYRLKRSEGRTYDPGIDLTVKAGERRTSNGAAVIEFVTRKGEEPGHHVHETEDEMFYVVEGELIFECDGRRYEAETGDFVFLPCGLGHGYAIPGDSLVRLLVITAPPREISAGWGGFVADFESSDPKR